MKKVSRWIHHTHIFRKDEYECSACHYTANRPLRICPRCGLPVNGSKYDPSWVNEMEMIDAILDN